MNLPRVEFEQVSDGFDVIYVTGAFHIDNEPVKLKIAELYQLPSTGQCVVQIDKAKGGWLEPQILRDIADKADELSRPVVP